MSHLATLYRELRPWLRLLGRRRGRLALGALLMAITAFAGIGLLALSGWFITATALTGMLLAAGIAASLDVYVPGGGIRFFAVTRTVARYLERLYNHDTVLRLLADLRGGMFRVLVRLDGQALAQRRASEWLNRLTADIDTLDSLYLRLLAPPLVALLAILGLTLLIGVFLPLAGLVAGGMLLLLWALLTLGQARLGMLASQRRVIELDRLRSRSIEHVQGLAELSAYGSLATHRDAVAQYEQRLYADQRRLGRLAALGNALVGLGIGITLLAVLWLASLAYASGTLNGPLMVMMPLAVLALAETLALLPNAFTQLGATRAAARRLNALGAAQGAIREAERPATLAPSTPTLAFDAVSLHYPGALTPALDRVSLSLAAGQRMALLGASGAGKSSLAQLATRLVDPQAGQVTLDANTLPTLSVRTVRNCVGLLSQQSELFDDSLAANLRLGAPAAGDGQLWKVLAMVELDAWAQQAQGLATRVGEGGRQLSGGQARRLCLARLLLAEPRIVMLDEPFAGLDAALAERIATRLNDWLAGRSLLLLCHQREGQPLAALGVGDWTQLAEGRVVAAGSA
ncbi:ATP-binding cassette, subfamily C, CydC [Franzmannia pantelleriensis]|uniref:ATP-binding cassette, subfamily C, CydC n=1 Tax=Franzmannia pantelleriensis TaxID=48727 RepID=A0A1G9EQJ4_9GAMM|nr:thiol reductant ABC exporter subunit CydC [Halomonas pantelleriensis]SDK78426.1 ATP-binding cassette, subfamily C, CydC [Halomonas pantelleriensis]